MICSAEAFNRRAGLRLRGQRGHLTPEVEWPLGSEMAFGVVSIFLK